MSPSTSVPPWFIAFVAVPVLTSFVGVLRAASVRLSR